MEGMTEKELWKYLDTLKSIHLTWDKLARELGVSKQYLFYCIKNHTMTPKLLKALKLEARYVKV
jgi:hypothetical protein